MHITELHLQTPSLAPERSFYTTTLGLPLVEETRDAFLVQAGETRLAFHETRQAEAWYHLAFTIPSNAWPQARAWLAQRVALLMRDGQDVFFIDSWNAHSMYFHDPAGNLVEFIAHQDLPAGASEAFGVQDIVRLSEIGLAVEQVPQLVELLHSWLSLDPYRGLAHQEFTAVGGQLWALHCVPDWPHLFSDRKRTRASGPRPGDHQRGPRAPLPSPPVPLPDHSGTLRSAPERPFPILLPLRSYISESAGEPSYGTGRVR